SWLTLAMHSEKPRQAGTASPQGANSAVTGPVRLLVLQSTPFCNIDCSYCYLPDRGRTRRLTLDVVRAVAEKLVAEGVLDKRLDICWNGGEPLTVPRKSYEEYIGALDDILLTICEVP